MQRPSRVSRVRLFLYLTASGGCLLQATACAQLAVEQGITLSASVTSELIRNFVFRAFDLSTFSFSSFM